MRIVRLVFVGLVFAASLFGNGLTTSLAASSEPSSDTRVVVAEDKTTEADCKSWVGSPANEKPCKRGSVIFARETTYGEVKQAGIKDYAILTGDSKQDEAIQDELVAKVRHDKVGKQSRQLAAACTDQAFYVGSNYLSKPGDANSVRITWEMQYRRMPDCSVIYISDHAKVSVSSYIWWRSCVNATSDCTDRNIIMDNKDWQPRPPNWKTMDFNSFVGREYRHISEKPCTLCGQPYGWWKFD